MPRQDVLQHLDHISKEVSKIRRLILLERSDEPAGDAAAAWDDLMRASTRVSRTWDGPTAVEEIRAQREK